MSDSEQSPPEPWRESYQRHAEGVRMVEDAADNAELYTQPYVDKMREQFYKLGWYDGGAGARPLPGPAPPGGVWGSEAPGAGPAAAPTPKRPVHIRYMEVGQEGYVSPFAILEHPETQTFAVDVRFDVIKEPDDTHTVCLKRLSPNTFSGRGPDLCRLWREPPAAEIPRVQYEKVPEATPQ